MSPGLIFTYQIYAALHIFKKCSTDQCASSDEPSDEMIWCRPFCTRWIGTCESASCLRPTRHRNGGHLLLLDTASPGQPSLREVPLHYYCCCYYYCWFRGLPPLSAGSGPRGWRLNIWTTSALPSDTVPSPELSEIEENILKNKLSASHLKKYYKDYILLLKTV